MHTTTYFTYNIELLGRESFCFLGFVFRVGFAGGQLSSDSLAERFLLCNWLGSFSWFSSWGCFSHDWGSSSSAAAGCSHVRLGTETQLDEIKKEGGLLAVVERLGIDVCGRMQRTSVCDQKKSRRRCMYPKQFVVRDRLDGFDTFFPFFFHEAPFSDCLDMHTCSANKGHKC